MTDDPVPTIVELRDGGTLAFQHYFVRDQCEPVVSGFHFDGIEAANPSCVDLGPIGMTLNGVVLFRRIFCGL